MRACVSAKRACGLASRTSQASASSNPPVTAGPLIAPITGPEKRSRAATGSRAATPLSPSPRDPRPEPSSFRSRPAQKARPAPVRTSTLTAGSSSSWSMTAASCAIRSRDRAFKACGRFSVTTAHPERMALDEQDRFGHGRVPSGVAHVGHGIGAEVRGDRGRSIPWRRPRAGESRWPPDLRPAKRSRSGKRTGSAVLKLDLHVGIDHAWGQRHDLGAMVARRLLEPHGARQMVHAGLGGAVGGAAGHGPAAEAR
jgi:hypothetical protein